MIINGPSDWLPAGPFRSHVRALICETGLSWRLIAAHAGVAPRSVHALLHGRRSGPVRSIHLSTARALTATSVESVQRAKTTLTDIEPSRVLLRELRSAGHPPEKLLMVVTADDWQLLHTPAQLSCTVAMQARVGAAYDLLTNHRHAGQPIGAERLVDCGQQQPVTLDRKLVHALPIGREPRLK